MGPVRRGVGDPGPASSPRPTDVKGRDVAVLFDYESNNPAQGLLRYQGGPVAEGSLSFAIDGQRMTFPARINLF